MSKYISQEILDFLNVRVEIKKKILYTITSSYGGEKMANTKEIKKRIEGKKCKWKSIK